MAIWKLRKRWDRSASWSNKLERIIDDTVSAFGVVEELISEHVQKTSRRGSELSEASLEYDSGDDEEVSF